MIETSAKYYPGLDLVRFGSAVLVMLLHLGWLPWVSSGLMDWTQADGAADPLDPLRAGFVGVQIFFVLSGLVIANSLSGGSTPGTFLRSRILRLVPGAFVCASISALVALAAREAPFAEIAVAWFASATVWPFGGWIEPVYWTLAIEIIFYGLIWLWLLSGQRVPLIVIILALQILSTIFLLSWAVDSEFFDRGTSRRFLLRHGCFFAAGMLMWMWAGPLRNRFTATALLLALAACFIQILLRTGESAGWREPYLLVLPLLLFAVAIGAIFWALRWSGESRLLRMLGLATYPLYLVHMPVGGIAVRFAVANGWAYWPSLILALTVSIAAALVISSLLEPRVRTWMKPRLEQGLHVLEGLFAKLGCVAAPKRP